MLKPTWNYWAHARSLAKWNWNAAIRAKARAVGVCSADCISGNWRNLFLHQKCKCHLFEFNLFVSPFNSCEERCFKTLKCRRHPCPMNCSDVCEDICHPVKNRSASHHIPKLCALLQLNGVNANLPVYMTALYSAIRQELSPHGYLSYSKYKLIQTKIDLLDPIRQICLLLNKQPKAYESCSAEILKRFDERMQMIVKFITNYKETKQQRSDVKIEISLLKLMADAIVKASALPLDETGRKLLNDAFELTRTSGCATENVRNGFSRLVNESSKYQLRNESKLCCSVMWFWVRLRRLEF